MYMHEWVGHGFFMPFMFLFPVILMMVFMMMRSSKHSSCHGKNEGKEDEALEIARKRFARGEIDEETFDKIKQKLS